MALSFSLSILLYTDAIAPILEKHIHIIPIFRKCKAVIIISPFDPLVGIEPTPFAFEARCSYSGELQGSGLIHTIIKTLWPEQHNNYKRV